MMHMIIKEESYEAYMNKTAGPALESAKQQCDLERGQGNRLYCVRYRAKNPRGTVLISHGFTETAEKYREVIWYFLNMGFHTVCIDHCGHGRSYRLTEDPFLVHVDRFERYVQDLLCAAKAAKAFAPALPLFLFGHSMGGGLAAAAAADSPELFQKVILSSPMIWPQTGKIPRIAAEAAVRMLCLFGREAAYAPGQKPYDGAERFEDSASVSRARFDYYQQKRASEPLFQMSAASCGWLREAARLRRFLMKKGWKRLCMPLLIFQAQQEDFVSNREMERFAGKVKKSGTVVLVKTTGTKHEIYNSKDQALAAYWERIRRFLCQG